MADLDAVLMAGLGPAEVDSVEEVETSGMDDRFSWVARKLVRAGPGLHDRSEELRSFLLHYMYFSQLRTPWYKEVVYPRLAREAVGRVVQENREQLADVERRELVPRGYSLAGVLDDLHRQQYAFTIARFAYAKMQHVEESDLSVELLLSDELPFVASDNPCRPFLLDDVRSISTQPVVSYMDPGACAVLPIGPGAAMVMGQGPSEPGVFVRNADSSEVALLNEALLRSSVERVVLPQLGPTSLFGRRVPTKGMLRAPLLVA